MINHRYQILEKLGGGGSGQVFLVEDILKQRQQYAMKILHFEDSSESAAAEQFRNEVSILAALNHPNLVRVFDFGIVRRSDDDSLNGRHFLAMEYIHGVTAENWFRSLHSDHDRAVHLKHVALQALEVLAYVHRQGIIHFDIKPDNFLLIVDGQKENDPPFLKLTDFGFSSRKDGHHEFPLRGTLEYTAPELLRRDPFDHRIDLYSLGASLYQLIEERCPFEANDPVELIKKVLTAEPEFHRSAGADYALFLPLLGRLLHKNPSDRFQSASEAASTLTRAEQMPPALFNHISKPGFVGRESEKKRISTAIASLAAKHPGEKEVAMLIIGQEGIGKTALLAEMVRFARASDVPVVEMNKSQRDVPFGAVIDLLSLLRAEVLSRSSSGGELTERFADVIDMPCESGHDNSKQLQTEWMLEREKTIESQARFINQTTLLFPLMVVVDDVDLLDDESAEVVKRVIRDGNPGRLLVLLSVRIENGFSVAASRLPLGELGLESVTAMSTSTLSPVAVGEAIGKRLYTLYGGSPSIIVEALYSAGKLLQQAGMEETSDITGIVDKVIARLPRDLDEFLLTRYRSLDRERQLTLDFLSCFASSAPLGVIQAVLPFQRQRTVAYLSSLEAEGLIISLDGGQRFSVRYAKLKSTISTMLHDNRQSIHSFIASTLESFPGVRSFADLQELAFQYKSGGQSVAAAIWLEAAADEGMQLAAYRRAGELYQEAVGLVTEGDTPDSARLNAKLARSLFHCGLFREAVSLANSTLCKRTLEKGQMTEVHKTAGLALSRLGEYEDGMRHISAALVSCSDSRERVELVQEMVGIEIARGNFPEAEQVGITQLELARRFGSQRMIASIYTDLGIATFYQDMYDQAVGYFQESMKIYSDTKQNARVADAMMNIGNVMSAKGDITQAVEYWMKALTISQEYGTLHQQAQIQNNLGIAHYKLKRFQEALSFYENAKTIFGRLESRQGSAYVLTNLGEVSFAEGRYEQGLLLWEDALQLYCEMEDGHGTVETLLQLVQVNLVLGDIESVADNLEKAEVLLNEKSLETFRSQLIYLRGMHKLIVNNHQAARQLFMKAEECTHESGEIAHRLFIKVRMAECDFGMGEHDSAVVLAQTVLKRGEEESHSRIIAEACLLLGRIAKASPSIVPEKALFLFRKGLEAIAKEPVDEVTWKLALSLGKEFYERGQRERAREFFMKAKLVLQFFLAQFTSSELKNQYLGVEDKGKVIATLESYLKT